MNIENLKKLFHELTDIILVERKVVFSLISLAFFFKIFFIWLEQREYAIDIEPILNQSQEDSSHLSYNSDEDNIAIKSSKLFMFRPDKVTFEQLLDLGFSKKQAKVFLNYRSKGGQFRTKEDVAKIYGVPKEFYQRLEPYIVIAFDNKSDNKNNSDLKNKTIASLDVNTASKVDWKSLPGIGEYYATKIYEKRIGLGAFIDLEQIAEIYNFPDTTFQMIKPYLRLNKSNVRKININTATEEELRKHPYVLKWQADDILRNRPIYGLEDLYDLKSYSDRTKNKYVGNYFEF